MHPRRIDMTGQRFGRLVVVSYAGAHPKGAALWVVRCDCGHTKVIYGPNLRKGLTRSCGCRQGLYKHGASSTPEYKAWAHAKERCLNPAHPEWPNYGGRGITMCDDWSENYAAFVAHLGGRPPGHSLDRIDNNGNYEPGNCRWATLSEQNKNRRPRQARV